MKFHLWIFISISLLASIALASQDVYEYQNSQGVTEFTDQVKADKEPVNHIQIKKMTPEEKLQSKTRLDQIKENDKALDEKVKLQKQLEYERNLRLQREQELKQSQKEKSTESDSNNSKYRNNLWIRYPIIRPPHRPIKPRPRPRPSKPTPRPSIQR